MFKKLLAKLGVIFNRIIDSLAILAGVLVVSLMLIMCYEVFMRYFLGIGVAWSVEISQYMIVFITFLGATWLLKKQGHVKVDFVISRISHKSQLVLNIVTSIIGVIISAIIFWFGWKIAWISFQKGVLLLATLSVPKCLFLGLISLCGLLLAIQFLKDIYGYVTSWKTLDSRNMES